MVEQNEREKLWRDMAELTFSKCRQKCNILGSCCTPGDCDMTRAYALEKGVVLQETGNVVLPFLDQNNQCVVPPHLRPLCALHQCDIAGLGFCPHDSDWTAKYFALRDRLNELID